MKKLRKRSETNQGSLRAFTSCACSCSCSCGCSCPVMTYYSTNYGPSLDSSVFPAEGNDSWNDHNGGL